MRNPTNHEPDSKESQPITNKISTKNWNLQRNILMSNQIWNYGRTLRLRASEKKVSTADKVNIVPVQLPHSLIISANLQMHIRKKNRALPNQLLLPRQQTTLPLPNLALFSQPKALMAATDTHLSSDKSNNHLNLSHIRISLNRLFVQNKAYASLPTLRVTSHILFKPTPLKPASSWILTISFHKLDPPWPPSFTRQPSTPYLATSTWYHNPPWSTNILQHHLPNIATLNSLKRLIPKHPSSFSCK